MADIRLDIDTSQTKELTVGIWRSGELCAKVVRPTTGGGHSQQLLSSIVAGLQQANIEWQDISAVSVVAGPGSFTGVRVGVSVANALSLALGVPVNDLAIGQFVVPVYAAGPNITVKQP